jgi:hypothetical protein
MSVGRRTWSLRFSVVSLVLAGTGLGAVGAHRALRNSLDSGPRATAFTPAQGQHATADSLSQHVLRLGTTDELVAVLIASSDCGASQKEELRRALRGLRSAIVAMPEAKSKRVVLIGAALDWAIPDGVAYLKSIGGFDEIAVGNSWLNAAAIQYIWQAPGRLTSIPQLVVFEREVTVTREGITVSPSHIIKRMRGVPEILAFLHDHRRA